MAAEKTMIPGMRLNIVASEAIAANTVVTAGGGYAAVSGDPIVGVAEHAAADATDITVIKDGVLLVTSGAAVTKSVEVMSDTAGKAITLTAGKHSIGVALDAATGADELIRVAR